MANSNYALAKYFSVLQTFHQEMSLYYPTQIFKYALNTEQLRYLTHDDR